MIEEIKKPPPPPEVVVPPPPKLEAPPPPYIPPPEVQIATPPPPQPTITAVTPTPPPAPVDDRPGAAAGRRRAGAAAPRPRRRRRSSAGVVCSNYTTVMGDVAFPREAIRQGLEKGEALIQFTLTANGEIKDVKALRARRIPIFARNSIRIVGEYKCQGQGRDVIVHGALRLQAGLSAAPTCLPISSNEDIERHPHENHPPPFACCAAPLRWPSLSPAPLRIPAHAQAARGFGEPPRPRPRRPSPPGAPAPSGADVGRHRPRKPSTTPTASARCGRRATSSPAAR